MSNPYVYPLGGQAPPFQQAQLSMGLPLLPPPPPYQPYQQQPPPPPPPLPQAPSSYPPVQLNNPHTGQNPTQFYGQ